MRATNQETRRLPALDAIRPQLEREWLNEGRETVARQKLDELLKRYKVTVQRFTPAAAFSQ